MRTALCPRLFQVEAMRDGRLDGAELARFGRHLTGCPACTREVEALELLAERLRATDPGSAGTDELRVCRERTRLLAAFDRAHVAPARRWRAPRRLLWPAAVAATVATMVAATPAGLFTSWRGRPATQPVRQLAAVIHSDATALWSERAEGERKTIVLQRGALSIHVDHPVGQPATPWPRGAARFVVVLPDGELEDLGTTFTVSAEDGHTTRVAVQEGSVVLRLRGRPPVAIGVGETWIRPRVETPAAPPAGVRPSPPPRLASPPRAPSIAPAIARPDPSLALQAAMAALHAGDNREAAAGFASFLARHPRDPRAEDAAYLRVLALQRCRAPADMRSAAQDYLRRYPAGFRRAEIERLAASP